MKIIRSKIELKEWRPETASVGFVPTMGALHEGHLSLVKKAKEENECVAASIFVNPTQFGPKEDLSRYPRTEEADLKLLKEAGVDMVFLPQSSDEIYGKNFDTWIEPRKNISEILEAKFRPGHFRGVATVVAILFHLVRPKRAYFGEKDFQQLRMMECMVEDLSLSVNIVRCPTVREASGLALSSRNRYLSEEAKQRAAKFHEIMTKSTNLEDAKLALTESGFEIQYLESWNEELTRQTNEGQRRWLAAAVLESIRLIDNICKLA